VNTDTVRTEYGVCLVWPDGTVEFNGEPGRGPAERQVRMYNSAYDSHGARAEVVRRVVTTTAWEPRP
jgi:hypothetical protein